MVARAMPMRFFCPPDIDCGMRVSVPAKATRCSRSATRSADIGFAHRWATQPAQWEGDIPCDIEVEECVVLEEHPDLFTDGMQREFVHRRDFIPVHDHATAVGCHESGDQTEDNAFPTRARADERGDTARWNVQRDPIEYG